MSRKGLITPFVAVVLFTVASGVFATWQDYGSNPVFSPPGGAYYPSVLYDDGNFSGHGPAYPYKMWYSNGAASAIGLAGSNDGLTWTVLSSAATGLTSPHHVQVLYDAGGFGGTGNYYRVWYWCTTCDLYSMGAIHTAYSADGIAWTSDQALTEVGTTVITGAGSGWNRGSYGPIALIYDAAGSNKYVMYYDGTTGGQEAWGLAYSADGLLWEGYNGGAAPVLSVGGPGAWDENYSAHGSVVRNSSGTWDLWYSGGVTASSDGVGHATSPDGIVWTKDPTTDNPLKDLGCASPSSGLGCAGSWNASRNYTPVVLAWPFGSTCPAQWLKMWRSGRPAGGGDSTKAIGYASMPSPTVTMRDVPGSYGTIQAAINASNPGDIIQIAAGTYTENLIVGRPVELKGAGAGSTTLIPAVSNPDCDGAGGGDPLCAGASSVILVRAGCVTVHDLTVDGDNPGITSGVLSGGVDVEARNGIICDQPLGPFDHLTVYNCRVKNIYLRGIYAYNPYSASIKPSISFHDNLVDNVAGSADYSIGIFSRYSTGTISRNTVENTPDAISANWSRGLRFLDNTVLLSGSGVHTDNAGSISGDDPDIIRGNTVSQGVHFPPYLTYGVWAFAPYQSVTISGNTATGLDIGLGAYGQGSAGANVSFTGNSVAGQMGAGSIGAQVTSDLLGWGSANVSATFSGDDIEDCATGLEIAQQSGYTTAVQVAGSTFKGHETAIRVTGAGAAGPSVSLGGSLGTANTIVSSCARNLELVNSPADVAAVYNFWGATCEPFIQEKIWDHADDPTLGIVSYNHWTDANHTADFTYGGGPPCGAPAFVSAVASPDNANLDSRQTLTLSNPAWSAVPNSFAFTWDAAFTVRSFSVDPDGILGFWQEMRPYGSPFIPSVSHEVIRTGASSAFVDINDDGSFDPGTDYNVVESGNTITVSRTVARGSVEDPPAGYRLLLQDSLFSNPRDEGTYSVQALLGSQCAAAWSGSTEEITGPPGAGCPPGSLTRDVGNTLRLTKSGNEITLSWDPVTTEPCMTGYAVFASHDCTQWPPYAPITGQDLDSDSTNPSLTAGLGLNLEFFLVAEAGDGGQIGPLGHYGM